MNNVSGVWTQHVFSHWKTTFPVALEMKCCFPSVCTISVANIQHEHEFPSIQWQQESSCTASGTASSPLRVQKNKLSSKFELITASLGSRTAAMQAASQQMLLTVLTHAVWLVLPLSACVNVYPNSLRLSLPPLQGSDAFFYRRASKVKCWCVGVQVSILHVIISLFLHRSSRYGFSCVYPESRCEVVAGLPNAFDKHRHKLLHLPHTVAITVQVKV